MAIAETLKVTNRVDIKVDKVDDKIDKVDGKVDKVDDKVDKVDDTVNRVDDKVTELIDGEQLSFSTYFTIPEHGYDSKQAVRKHRVTRETGKVAFSSGSLLKSQYRTQGPPRGNSILVLPRQYFQTVEVVPSLVDPWQTYVSLPLHYS